MCSLGTIDLPLLPSDRGASDLWLAKSSHGGGTDHHKFWRRPDDQENRAAKSIRSCHRGEASNKDRFRRRSKQPKLTYQWHVKSQWRKSNLPLVISNSFSSSRSVLKSIQVKSHPRKGDIDDASNESPVLESQCDWSLTGHCAQIHARLGPLKKGNEQALLGQAKPMLASTSSADVPRILPWRAAALFADSSDASRSTVDRVA